MTGLRETARILGVDHAYLSRLAKQRRVPRKLDGTFDPELVRKAIAATTDPAFVRPKRGDTSVTKSESPVTTAQPVELRLALAVFRKTGAIAAKAAIDAGASVRVAFALRNMIGMDMASLIEDEADALKIPTEDLRFEYAATANPDWASLAEAAGEQVDFKLWRAWAAERERVLELAEVAASQRGS